MKLISAIQLNNFLSFSQDSKEFKLNDLNVLIGTNGSGKSNFLDAIAILRSFAIGDTINIFSRGGGIQQWIFERKIESSIILTAKLNINFVYPIEHVIAFTAFQGRYFNIEAELLRYIQNYTQENPPKFLYKFNNGKVNLILNNSRKRKFPQETINFDSSILTQRKDPENYPEISKISELYSKIRMYRNWEFGRVSMLRNSQKTDLRNVVLEEDFSNFFIFLSRFFTRFKRKHFGHFY
jgi:predicted ATPase